jgi:hypothetical protein
MRPFSPMKRVDIGIVFVFISMFGNPPLADVGIGMVYFLEVS